MNALNTALTTIRRSPYQALIAVLMTSLTFFIGFVVSFSVIGADVVLKHVESLPQIIAFFELGTSNEAINDIKTTYEANSMVSEVRVVTQADALEIYRKANSDNPLMLELVTADFLPASIEMKTHNLKDLATIKNQIEKEAVVEDAVLQQDVITTIEKWTAGLRLGGVVAVSVLALVSFLSITVVIALKATNQKSTISIFRLLGATQGFVKLPFILEGVVYGVMGCLIGWVGSFITTAFALPHVQDYLGDLLPIALPLPLLASQLGVGILISICLGAIAGFMAVSRLMRT